MRKQKLNIDFIKFIIAIAILAGGWISSYAVNAERVKTLREDVKADSDRVREQEKKVAGLEAKLDAAINILVDIKKEVKR